jgi:hypothetical protein
MKLIFLIISLLFVSILFLNYWHGKHFHSCTECDENIYKLIDVNLPPDDTILLLEESLKTHGSQLNPELNFNNAKGKKLNSIEIGKHCRGIIEWSTGTEDELCASVSHAIGEKVTYADESEKYRIFARIYDDEDDFLNWHYDNNFTRGNRYTLVIPVILDECNTSEFQYKDRKTGDVKTVKIPLGQGVLYNGSEMYHRITQQTKGCRRVVIIIPFYADYSKSIIGEIREKFRNMTYQQLKL